MSTKSQLSLIDALKDLLDKVTGDDGDMWLRGLCRFLRRENPWTKLDPFITIKIGTYKDIPSLRKALEDSGVSISESSNSILDRVTLSKSEKLLDLVVLSVADLGLSIGAGTLQVYDAAKKQGFELCPAEVGPQLRLQYIDQPNGEFLQIAMEDITHTPVSFCVSNFGGNMVLEDAFVDPFYHKYGASCSYEESDEFVFVKPN
jgi:hypothetical protein